MQSLRRCMSSVRGRNSDPKQRPPANQSGTARIARLTGRRPFVRAAKCGRVVGRACLHPVILYLSSALSFVVKSRCPSAYAIV